MLLLLGVGVVVGIVHSAGKPSQKQIEKKNKASSGIRHPPSCVCSAVLGHGRTDLRGEGLGGGDRGLAARVEVDAQLGGARDEGAHRVDDRERGQAQAVGQHDWWLGMRWGAGVGV